MTDTPPNPKPKHRRWRWLVVGMCALACTAIAITCLKVRALVNPLQRAEGLQLGQSISEVEQIMGSPGYAMKVGRWREIRMFGLEQTMKLYASRAQEAVQGKVDWVPAIDQWPVVVHFDPSNGRVFKIKKGDVWFETDRASTNVVKPATE
jgi:hypothetical protein